MISPIAITRVVCASSASLERKASCVPGKDNHTFSSRPIGIANAVVVQDVICEVRFSLLRDKTDLQLAYRNAGVSSVKVGVLACACP